MDLTWIAITFSETIWMLLIFVLGFLASRLALPPMVGFLVGGFVLHYLGVESTQALREVADLGVTLMLFTIGLKLDLKSLLKIQIWGVASAHMLITTVIFGVIIFVLGTSGVSVVAGLNIESAILIAFALSFSSTVFAVKVLEEKREMNALYGQIAIGILIMQDLFAVLFLTASTGKIPSYMALGLLLLPFVRPVLYKIMDKVDYGELLILYGLLLALGGAAIFEWVGMKADLGALLFGVLMASHRKASQLSKTLYGFKDLFLVGFFVNIGLSGEPGLDNLIIAAILSIVMFAKVLLFFWLLLLTKLRSRTSFLASLSLANYSEFGLIVAAIGVGNGWLSADWLITIAIALSITFVLASPLNAAANRLYSANRLQLSRWQSSERIAEEKSFDVSDAHVLILGMGRVGTGAYDDLTLNFNEKVLGVDFSKKLVEKHLSEGRRVINADAMDATFWEQLHLEEFNLILVNMSDQSKNIIIIEALKQRQFAGKIAAIAKYDDHIEELQQAGASAVYNIYSEAGIGFAEHVRNSLGK